MTPPNVLNLEELSDKTKSRTGSSRGRVSNVPDVHVHNYFGEAGSHPHLATNDRHDAAPTNTSTGLTFLKRKRINIPESSDDESDIELLDYII